MVLRFVVSGICEVHAQFIVQHVAVIDNPFFLFWPAEVELQVSLFCQCRDRNCLLLKNS